MRALTFFLLFAFSLSANLQEITFSTPQKRGERVSFEKGIILENDLLVPKPQKFSRKMAEFLGKKLNKELLGQIRGSVEEYYRNEGYPLIAIVIPEQRVSGGNLSMDILVAERGKVTACGAQYFSEKWIAKQISIKEGEEIQTAPLLGDLHWINENPFMNTTIVYEKGKNLGETNIELITRDRFPVRLYGGYENNGYLIAGDSRYFTGVNFGRFFLPNDQINVQFMSSHVFEKWWAVAGNYILPFPWRHTLKVFGAYSKTRPGLVDQSLPEASRQRGFGWQVGARYVANLPNFTHYFHQARVGYDFKRTNNFLVFGTIARNTPTDISQFILGYEGTVESDFGFLVSGIDFYISPGKMTSDNTDSKFAQQRPGAKANYVYGKVSLDGVIRMPLRFSWEFAAVGQASSGKLLPTEQLSVGGALTVRGYDENEVIGDQGFLLRNELRSPPIGMLNYAFRNFDDRLQFLVFVDFGWANDVDKSILPDNNEVLASAGPGVRYAVQEYLSFRFDYGWQLHHISDRRFGSGDHSRMHLGLIVGF